MLKAAAWSAALKLSSTRALPPPLVAEYVPGAASAADATRS
jgi:hypothetical protein